MTEDIILIPDGLYTCDICNCTIAEDGIANQRCGTFCNNLLCAKCMKNVRLDVRYPKGYNLDETPFGGKGRKIIRKYFQSGGLTNICC